MVSEVVKSREEFTVIEHTRNNNNNNNVGKIQGGIYTVQEAFREDFADIQTSSETI